MKASGFPVNVLWGPAVIPGTDGFFFFFNSLSIAKGLCVVFCFGKRSCEVLTVWKQVQAGVNSCVVKPAAEMTPGLPPLPGSALVFTMLHDLIRRTAPQAGGSTGCFQIVYRRGCEIKLSFNLFSSGTIWGCSKSEKSQCFAFNTKTREIQYIENYLLPVEPGERKHP